MLTPVHTPGHLWEATHTSRGCNPVQLEEPGRQSMGDVDTLLAVQSRQRLFRWLADRHTIGVGAHFPELHPDDLATTRWNPTLSR